MTKTVRIENGDSSTSYKVVVQPQRLDEAGGWVDDGPSFLLGYPTALHEFGIHTGKRLVVSEIPS